MSNVKGGNKDGRNSTRYHSRFAVPYREIHSSSEDFAKGRCDEQAVEQQEIYKICKNVRSILEKLTPQNFHTSVTQMLSLKVNTVEKLEKAIDIIFEIATGTPDFIVAHAHMCRKLSDNVQAPLTMQYTVDGKQVSTAVTFRKILINKCQEQFEKDFVDIEKLEEARNKYFKQKMEFTMASLSSHASQVEKELIRLLKEKNDNVNTNIISYIEEKVAKERQCHPEFIHMLTSIVCNSSIKEDKNSCTCDRKLLKLRINILERFINSRKELELQALFALQQIAAELNHPRGLLPELFEQLYEDDVISEDTFYVWELSKEYPDGKGTALSSVKGFLIWLHKAEEEYNKEDSTITYPIQNETTNDSEKKDGEWGSLKEEQDLKEIVNCKKMQGNIRFIGELFKLKMISENIMHNCILHLLQIKLNEENDQSREDQLECLCTLLATIGKIIDHKKAKPRIDQYFDQIQKFILKIKLSSRIKSALQDIIKLRANNWVPTVDEVHEETEADQARLPNSMPHVVSSLCISVMNDRQDQQNTALKAPLPNSIPHVVSTLEELYKCPVCLEIFENPYTLPCQHPLCKECLDGLIQIDGGMTIKCPLCNAVHLLDKDISCLKAPLTMMQTVECLKANRSSTQGKHICEAAGCKRAIVTYCVNSKTYLCKPCKNNDDYNITQGHLLPDTQRYQSMKYSMNKDMVAPFCYLHESFETRCCWTCNELCCIYCYVSKHNDHQVGLLNEYNTHNFHIYYEDKIEELQSMKTNLESKKVVSQSYIVDLNSDADAIKKVIKLNTKKIIEEFAAKANEFEVQLLNALASHQAKQCGLLSKSIYENNCDVAKLSSVIEEVDRYKKKSEMERFYHYSEMKDILENIYQEQAFRNKSDEGPSKPSFEVCNLSNDSDLVLTEMKDKFKLIVDKLLTQI